MDTRTPQRQGIGEVSAELDVAVLALNLDHLRRTFAELFDRAAEVARQAALDLDDVVFERYLVLHPSDGATVRVPADWLSDRQRLLAEVGRATQGLHGGLEGVTVSSAVVCVVREV